ncbi:hypothetical protein PR048_029157 [Dryococelus australis]|uniref:Uncharacterized protein n=1 Tax=Dryococelus australis TaxID=614101 RepID=A0ABQ9GCK4_9NEOP|nr:hypothetical protein PR048_029157 [Dryococelus australis]
MLGPFLPQAEVPPPVEISLEILDKLQSPTGVADGQVGQWDQYPCSLYVTVKGIHRPDNLQPALRSRSALQSEHSTCRINIEPAEPERQLESSATTSLPVSSSDTMFSDTDTPIPLPISQHQYLPFYLLFQLTTIELKYEK